jgi:cell shape-determining protein MreC
MLEFLKFVVATKAKLVELHGENEVLRQRLATASDLDNQVSRYKRQIAEIRREYDVEHQRRTKAEKDIEKMVSSSRYDISLFHLNQHFV